VFHLGLKEPQFLQVIAGIAARQAIKAVAKQAIKSIAKKAAKKVAKEAAKKAFNKRRRQNGLDGMYGEKSVYRLLMLM
jgi:hypothetical protein